jgi:hypothetical protein
MTYQTQDLNLKMNLIRSIDSKEIIFYADVLLPRRIDDSSGPQRTLSSAEEHKRPDPCGPCADIGRRRTG